MSYSGYWERERENIHFLLDSIIDILIKHDERFTEKTTEHASLAISIIREVSWLERTLTSRLYRYLFQVILLNNKENYQSMSYDTVRQFLALSIELRDITARRDATNFWEELKHALMALNVGETQTILKANKRGFSGNKYTLDKLRFYSVMWVYYEWGNTGKKNKALEKISKDLGITIDRILSWEKTIVKKEDPDKQTREKYKKIGKQDKSLSIKEAETAYDSFDDIYNIELNILKAHLKYYPPEKLKIMLSDAHQNGGSIYIRHDGEKVIIE